MRNKFVYEITVVCKKRFGGTVTAKDAAEAVAKLIKIHKLEVRLLSTTIRPMDCAIIKTVDFFFEGKRAAVKIYARPEDFLEEFGNVKG